MSPANHRDRTADEQAALDKEHTTAREKMKALEDGESVPADPKEWPTGKAKFLTFGNDGDHAYGDGPTAMLGPAGLELHADGTSSVRGGVDRAPAPAAEKATVKRRFGFGRRSKGNG